MNPQEPQIIIFLPLFYERPEIGLPPFDIKAIFGNIFTDLAGIEAGMIGRLLVIDLGYFDCFIQRLADLQIKPVIYAVGKKIDGHNKQQYRGNQGKADKSHY